MATLIKLKRDTEASWANVNPVLSQGEPGVEIDTGRIKIGDGVTDYANLTYSAFPLTDLSSLTIDVETTGNVTANQYFGDGSNLTGVTISDLDAFTTDDLSEGNANLYYTDGRVRAAVSSSGDLSYNASTGVFSVTTYKSTDFDTDFGNKSTTDLAEGTNLYYTDSRARDSVSASGDLSYSNATGVFSVTTYKSTDFDTDFGNKSTTDLTEGTNLYFSNARVNAFIQSSITTTDIDEGTNLYYTDNRVDAHLLSGAGGATFTDNVTVQGNLEVQGNVDYVNVEDLLVKDHEIVLNFGNASAQDAFITVDRSGSALSNAQIRWNETADAWEFSNDGSTYQRIATSTTELSEGTNLYYTDARVNTFIQNNTTTSDIDEGTNLYFTDSRARDAISATGNILFDSNTGIISEALTTDDVDEGGNQYYTTARANAAIQGYAGNMDSVGTITASTVDADVVSLKQFTETTVDTANVSGNITVDFGAGTIHNLTVTGNIDSITLANTSNGSSGTLIITQDGGPHSFATGAGWLFAGGDNTISDTANATDIVSVVVSDGTNYASITRGYA